MFTFLRLIGIALFLGLTLTAQTFSSGAGKVEITPPPAWPTGGHGPAGAISRGYWNPLYARAFYVGDGSTSGVIFVSCDMFAVPLGLRAAVWKRIQTSATALGLGAESLILAATHSHQGPGNYLTAQVYNEFGSNISGFSQPLFEFLAEQIGHAVQMALSNRKDAILRLHSKEITESYKDQFVMNRSPAVFTLNYDREKVLDQLNKTRPWRAGPNSPNLLCKMLREDGEPDDQWDLPGCPRLRAVNRRMTILELLRSSDQARIGALIFFAVHPTDLIHTAPIYNSDFVGQAVDGMEADWPGVTVGFFNGAEGDITARRRRRDILEGSDRSMQFRKAVHEVLASEGKVLNGKVESRARLLDTQSPAGRKCGDIEIADQPSFGAAGVGGAEGDRTPLYALGWREGVRRSPQGGQGPKVPALDSVILPDIQLSGVLAPASHFPRFLPVTYVRLGAFELGAIPVEMSTTAASRIREELGGELEIVGLANEYASYTATESEYAAQDYMGASTLWGPNEAAYLGCQLLQLKKAPSQPGTFLIPDSAYNGGPPPRRAGGIWLLLSLLHIWKEVPFGPAWVGDRQDAPDDGLDELLLNKSGIAERHLPYFEWEETVDPAHPFQARRDIEIQFEDGARADNSTADFLKILTEAPSKAQPDVQRWSAIWLRPLWEDMKGKYRFAIKTSNGTVWLSKWFTVQLDSTAKPRPEEVASGGQITPAGAEHHQVPPVPVRLKRVKQIRLK